MLLNIPHNFKVAIYKTDSDNRMLRFGDLLLIYEYKAWGFIYLFIHLFLTELYKEWAIISLGRFLNTVQKSCGFELKPIFLCIFQSSFPCWQAKGASRSFPLGKHIQATQGFWREAESNNLLTTMLTACKAQFHPPCAVPHGHLSRIMVCPEHKFPWVVTVNWLQL